MRAPIKILLCFTLCMATGAQAAKLTMDDKVARWPRATTDEKIDFATRMGKAFTSLSPDLDRNYFIKCLEETANIGNPRDIKLEEAVKMCVAVNKPPSEPE